MFPWRRKTDVVFLSRDDESCYQWVSSFLKTLQSVRSVLPLYISSNYLNLNDLEIRNPFFILYHTKRRGRINLTNVTDSLYDRELAQVSNSYGRHRVIVVVDDLEDSSDEQKRRILHTQPSLKLLAWDLFLFDPTEKDKSKLHQIQTIVESKENYFPGRMTVTVAVLLVCVSVMYKRIVSTWDHSTWFMFNIHYDDIVPPQRLIPGLFGSSLGSFFYTSRLFF
uniref:Uncharacterized protein n=1 Tax=Leptobrachium leishanense TaxID=445787 RepID=A0A8C5QJK5_9ANUR